MSDNGSVAHRLRNQLSIILGFSNILIGQCPEADVTSREDLLEIRKAAETALALLPEIEQPVGRSS